MGRIEKTVFVSYRRADGLSGVAIFQDLTQHGYDVFIDYDGIASGKFESVILENIRARAHFLVLLTPTALERCGDPNDWMRREIEAALDSRRNIVPLMLAGFDFRTSASAGQLTGKLAALKEYNGLPVPEGYFPAAMDRLRNKFLNVPVDAVLHPASDSAQQVAEEQKDKATKAPRVILDAKTAVVGKSGEDESQPQPTHLDLTTPKAALDKARYLISLKLNEEAIAIYDDLIARFGSVAELSTRECVASALGDKFCCLLDLNRLGAADKVFKDLLIQFGTATELPLQTEVARAFHNLGNFLIDQKRDQEAINVFNNLQVQFGTATELSLREYVASALIKKGLALKAFAEKAEADKESKRGRDHREAAIGVYDDLIARFGGATELPLRKFVARALINKAVELVSLNHKDSAFPVYDDLIARFGTATELPLREYVAQALFGKKRLYCDANDWDNTIALCDDLIARFGTATELSLREFVARARLKRADGFDALGRSEEAVAVLKDFQAQFGTTSELWLLKMLKEAKETENRLAEKERAKQWAALEKLKNDQSTAKEERQQTEKKDVGPARVEVPTEVGLRGHGWSTIFINAKRWASEAPEAMGRPSIESPGRFYVGILLTINGMLSLAHAFIISIARYSTSIGIYVFFEFAILAALSVVMIVIGRAAFKDKWQVGAGFLCLLILLFSGASLHRLLQNGGQEISLLDPLIRGRAQMFVLYLIFASIGGLALCIFGWDGVSPPENKLPRSRVFFVVFMITNGYICLDFYRVYLLIYRKDLEFLFWPTLFLIIVCCIYCLIQLERRTPYRYRG